MCFPDLGLVMLGRACVYCVPSSCVYLVHTCTYSACVLYPDCVWQSLYLSAKQNYSINKFLQAQQLINFVVDVFSCL